MGSAFHTYISRKQINVIFAANKRGDIVLPKECISYLYNNVADARMYNNNNNYENFLCRIRYGIDEIFQNNYENAQNEIVNAFGVLTAAFRSREIDAIKTALCA